LTCTRICGTYLHVMLEKYSARTRRQALVAISVLAAAALLGAAFALSSSMRNNGPTEHAAVAPKPGATAAPASSPPPQAIGPAPQPSPQSGPKPVAPLAASIRAYGLGAPSTPRVAEDFSLGPLQSYRPAEGDEAAVFAVARAFMDGIAAGKLDRELLLPEARNALSFLLAPTAQTATGRQARADAPAYRLGAIFIRGEDASLKVRLPSADTQSKLTSEAEPPTGLPAEAAKPVREEGLLSLRKIGDAWYVEALALAPPKSGTLAFAPDAPDLAK
jgi:hypothetical protein